jgi:RecA-family ATPase
MPSRFKLLSRADLDSLPEAKWLIPGLLAAESFAVLYGPPGSAKTFLALELALSIASGIEGSAGLGKPVESGAVIYVAGEGVRGIRKRIEAWERQSHGRFRDKRDHCRRTRAE